MEKEYRFSSRDIEQIESLGLTVAQVLDQLEIFKRGPSYMDLIRPCTAGDGIFILGKQEAESLAQAYEQALGRIMPVKFVPASGAATRMFQALFSFQKQLESGSGMEPFFGLASQGDADALNFINFFNNIDKFSFWPELEGRLKQRGLDAQALVREERVAPFLDELLSELGLNYGSLPKGLIPFHYYGDNARTAFEEHIVEALDYARDGTGTCRVHFTVRPESLGLFQSLWESLRPVYEEKYQARFELAFSEQDPRTNTIAAGAGNVPFRAEDGSLVFRPGGHGALIGNLNSIDADIVFANNIDNVVFDREKEKRSFWKKVLAGLLLAVQEKVFGFLNMLSTGPCDPALIKQASDFAWKWLYIQVPVEPEKARAFLKEKLDRPFRVCGMVLNEVEPGGAPFWVRAKDGSVSLQVVEKAQVDPGSPAQNRIFSSSSHFNPVDVVCGVRDRNGKKYDLSRYLDPDAVFISEKTKKGISLKALELPGLWNGAMSAWNTIFVEVPGVAFRPVKTVNDLLRPEHQPC